MKADSGICVGRHEEEAWGEKKVIMEPEDVV